MPRFLLRASLLGCFAFLLLLQTTNAQEVSRYRADSTLFFKGRLGLNFYGGDRDINPGDELQKYIENIGFSFGLELGYSFTNRFSLSLHHLSGTYPRIEDIENDLGIPFPQPAYGVLDQSTTSKWRHHFTLLGRGHILPNKRVSPYGQMGLNLSFGRINDSMETGIGPMAGIGLDFAVSDRMGLFLELDGIFILDDEALDLADTQSKETPNAPRNIDASDFDVFTFIGFGLRINAKSPFVPVYVDCTGPTTLVPGVASDTLFAADYNDDATEPVTVVWDFGDGTTASGLGPHEKIYANSGTEELYYDVTVTASNRKSTDTAVCRVKVLAPPRCTIAANPATFDTCQQPLPPVSFTSTVSGSQPISYRWDFGVPGAAPGTQPNPSYTYERDDLEPTRLTRTATLRITNPAGSALCTTPVYIDQCPCNPNLIFGTACFARYDSVLPEGQARQNLQDNLDILRANPQTVVVVAGYAQPNERNAQALADDRARTVAQFYIDNGINPDRIVTIGLVELEGAKTGPVCTQTVPFCSADERNAYLEQQRQQYPQQEY